MKKSELRQLIREEAKRLNERNAMPTPDDDTDVDEYVTDLQNAVARKYKTTQFKGWTADLDDHSGALEWTYTDDARLVVLATPFWETEPYVPVSVFYDDDVVRFDQAMPLKPTYYQAKDIATYMNLMGRILPEIVKKYAKV